MLYLVLFLIFLFIVFFVSIVGFFIDYHFKRLGIDDDLNSLKIIKTYKIGALAILLLAIFSFILLMVFARIN